MSDQDLGRPLYKENKFCLVCEQPMGSSYLNLGDQPLANSYHHGQTLPKFPLQMKVCNFCYHSQLSVSVDPHIMFDNYLYISDTSRTLTDYFEWVTDYILARADKPKKVLEIACNSGLLLEMFKNRGLECVGVDPAQNLRELSVARGLDVYVDYWNQETSELVKQERGQFDLILAFHVLPHVPDPGKFLNACRNVLAPNGKIFIQTSQCDMLLNNEFDVIYHEHSSYFTAKSIEELAHRHQLGVTSITKTDIHSKSYLFSLSSIPLREPETELAELLKFETEHGLYDPAKYEKFTLNAHIIKEQLLDNLTRLRSEGYTLIGYGAAAKGNTLLNFIDFKLDYIIDDNEMKWGYLTPGTDIEIHGIQLLTEQQFEKICFIPLAWNFYAEIKQRIQSVRDTKNDLFVRYFPFYREEQ